MFHQLLKVRYVAVLITLLMVLHSFAAFVIGAQLALRGYREVLSGNLNGRPGLELLHSLDFLFISIVLIIVALGIAKLFLRDPSTESDASLPRWLRIDSISELKVLLWETILVTMLIIALSDLSTGVYEHRSWTVLITPGAIFLLAVSLYFMKKV
jgi:uncharacterized membrane protein YqhA